MAAAEVKSGCTYTQEPSRRFFCWSCLRLPSLAAGDDDSHAAGTPRYPRGAGEGSPSLLFPPLAPCSHPCWVPWGLVAVTRDAPWHVLVGFGFGLTLQGWG